LQIELRELALHDPLTGLYNRHYLNETLPREFIRLEREGAPLSIIMADIDHFKSVNDNFGHLAGDQALVEIASVLKRCTRGSDIICRYGGEEFLLAMPGANLDLGAKRAEEIRLECAKIAIIHHDKKLSLTLSFGVAAYPMHGERAELVINDADRALYLAKNRGRNRVVVWEENNGATPRGELPL
jgi:diguanylate cyclase (GGDEF)-like protein